MASEHYRRYLRLPDPAPIYIHTHDASGIAPATVLAGIEFSVDIIDAAMDAVSGSTSPPCLGAIVDSTKTGPFVPPPVPIRVLTKIEELWSN